MPTFSDEDEDERDTRFFSSESSPRKILLGHGQLEDKDGDGGEILSEGEDLSEAEESEAEDQNCVTLRVLQRCLPCVQNKTLWDISKEDIFQAELAEEVKYPTILKILDSATWEFIFICSSLMSVVLLFFSEAFLLESRIMWGIIHFNNFIYSLCMFGSWLDVLIKTKFAKIKRGFDTVDTALSLISVLPIDIVVLVIYLLNEGNDTTARNTVAGWITISRLTYFLRMRNVFHYLSKWEDQIGFGDFKMFLIKTSLYGLLFVHVLACIWHRIACEPFTVSHFLLKPTQATADVCTEGTWVTKLLSDKIGQNKDSPLLRHAGWNVVVDHYLVCLYWAIVTVFRLGASDILASLTSDWEVAFTSITQIVGWIFVIAYVSGSLTSILVEMDTEKENFLTRRFAIDRYLSFSSVTNEIRNNVNRFYDYLWARSRGIHNWDLVEQMPLTMRTEIHYDVNKFVLDQLPLFANLDEPFLMSLSIHMKHKLFLRGEALQRKGDTGDTMFYVINGFLEVMHGDETNVLSEVRSGSAIGELFLLQSYSVVATVRCGSECDILVLHKEECKKVLKMYPEYKSILQKRIETRLEQCGLLLALCEKHNQYGKAFNKLRRPLRPSNEDENAFYKGYEMVAGVLDSKAFEETVGKVEKPNDFDDLAVVVDPGPKDKYPIAFKEDDDQRESPMSFGEALAAVNLAVESDVGRAAALSKDLGMARAPLFIKAPRRVSNVKKVSQEPGKGPFAFIHLGPNIVVSHASRTESWKVWKFVVLLCIMTVIFFIPYRAAFGNHAPKYFDLVTHIFDFIFCVDFVLDAIQPVVLAHRTLETRKEIMRYRLRQPYFWIRLFSFLPIEYVLGRMIGLTRNDDLFYLLKFNRLILYVEGIKFFHLFDASANIAPEYLFTIRFALRLFYIVHGFAIIFEVLLKYWANPCKPEVYASCIPILDYPKDRYYGYLFYWATEVLTATGYGDFPLRDDLEIATTVVGLIFGASMIFYLNGRIAAITANNERRRVMFKQLYYSISNFMTERRFVKGLMDRVLTYYKLQWNEHEGVLIPNQEKHTAIYDAPTNLLRSVSFAQGSKYVKRIPLFMFAKESLVNDICAALNQYIVPPKEVLVHPKDITRELYIIVKGYCKVTKDGKYVGKLGEGNYFGLGGLIYGINRPYLIETVNYCQVFCLEFHQFVEIAKNNADFMHEFKLLRRDAVFPKAKFIPKRKDWVIFPRPKKKSEPKPKVIEEVPPRPILGSSSKIEDDARSIASFATRSTTITTPSSTIASKASVAVNPVASEEEINRLESVLHTEYPIGPVVEEEHVETLKKEHSSRKQKLQRFLKKLKTWTRILLVDPIIPHGTPLKCWAAFRILCAFLIGNFVPIAAAFSVHPTYSLSTIWCFDLVAWIDISVCLRVGYYGGENQLITSFRKTARHYLKGPFVLDLLGSFPFDLLIITFNPRISALSSNPTYDNMYNVISLMRLTRMIQCYRLFMSGRLMSKTIFKSLSLVLLLELVPLMGLFLNMMTCFAVLAVCGLSVNGEPITCSDNPRAWIINKDNDIFQDSWYTPETLMKYPVTSYIIGTYFVVNSALCVGFGDINIIDDPRNRSIAIAVIFVGVVITGFLVSQLTACQVGEDSRRIKIRETTKIISQFLEDNAVPKDLRRRVQEYYYGAWDKTKGVYPADLFSALHPSLKADVMKTLYQDQLKLSPLFATLDEPGIRMLASKLHEMFVPEGEYVFEFGDLSGDIYFISKGLVAIYTDKNEGVLAYVGSGSLIGEISCLFDIQRIYTAVAATDVEIFVIQKPDFLDFLSLYPNIRHTLEQSCIHHFRESLEAREKVAKDATKGDKLAIGKTTSSVRFEADSKPIPVPGQTESSQDFQRKLLQLSEAIDSTMSLKQKNKSETTSSEMKRSSRRTKSISRTVTTASESLRSLGIVEMDLASALQVTEEECENRPDFVMDPLRVKASKSFVSLNKVKKEKERRLAVEKKKWSSYFVSFGKIPRDEMGLIHIMQEREKFQWLKFTIHPLSRICTWASFYLLLTAISCGLTAYEIAFHTEQEATNLFVLRCLMEIFFIVRIIGSFHLGYYDEYGVIVSDVVKITRRYILSPSGLFLDFVTTFPFYFITYFFGAWRKAEIAADIRGLQMFRVFLFARYLKQTETELRMKLSRIKIIKVTILLGFIFHFCACAWYLVACDGLKCRAGSWMSILIKDMMTQQKILVPEDISINSRYLLALYYVTTAITFTGLGDITPRTQVELCLTIAMLFTTVFVIGFLVGEMTQCLASQVQSKIHFRHKLNVMEHHLMSLSLSGSKLANLRKYFQTVWARCNGRPFTKIIEELPYPLRADITMKVYGSNIRGSRVFGRLDDTVIRQLSARVKHEIFMPGAHIIRSGTICTAVYFIKKGEVAILDERGSTETCVDVLYENECFGEVKVLLPIKEQFQFSYVARLETETGVLYVEDLTDVLNRHHGLLEEVIRRANWVKEQRITKKGEEDKFAVLSELGRGSSTTTAKTVSTIPSSRKSIFFGSEEPSLISSRPSISKGRSNKAPYLYKGAS